MLPDEASSLEDSDVSHETFSTIHADARYPKLLKQNEWTTLQYIEAKSVLNNYLKLQSKKCKNCQAKNPKISKPTFGWFRMVYFSHTFSA